MRFPVSITPNGKNIGTQGGVHFTNLTVIDELETLPGGAFAPGPLEASSKRAWLNATVPKGLEGLSGDVTVVNSHGCSEILTVGAGAPKEVSLKVTCKTALKSDDAVTKWSQDVFGISDWVTPSIHTSANWKADVDRRMKEFADANFTVANCNTNGVFCNCISH